MKKLYKILLIAGLLLIVLILSLRFIQSPKYKFVKDPSNSFIDYAEDEYIISPYAIAKSINNHDSNTILIDVRNKHEYVNGHIEGAKHMAKETILEEENFEFFEDLKAKGQNAILYGEDVIEANIPFMILKQMGIENISISSKGYDFFVNNDLKKIAASEIDYTTIEIPATDFAKFVKNENNKAEERIQLAKEKKKVVYKAPTKKKTVVTKPKAAPVEEEEEEDEGC